MYWNYRVFYLGEDEAIEESIFGICEVYYENDDKPTSRTGPVVITGSRIGAILLMMQQALKKPILNMDLTEYVE